MAHTCPECGQICHCNGDIDDLCLELEEDITSCNHWTICNPDEDDTEDENDTYKYDDYFDAKGG